MQTLRETYGGGFMPVSELQLKCNGLNALKTSEPCELFAKLAADAQSWLPLAAASGSVR